MNSVQHLWSFLSGKKTYLISMAGVLYAWGITHNLWQHDPLIDTLLMGGGVAALRHGWKTEAAKIVQTLLEAPPVLPLAPATTAAAVTAAAPATAKSGFARSGLLLAIFLIGSLALICAPLLLLPGCAALQPGADPFIVRIEQTQSSAKPAFDFLLSTENANREFWRTNPSGFYWFCEWLRQPQPVSGMTAFGTNIAMSLPRASAMQWNLDQIKQSYKAGRSTSNEVFTVLSTLEGAVTQAATWSSVLTNSVH